MLYKTYDARDRDDALRVRLAHVKLAGRPICSLTHDEPFAGGYLGTALTASLCPDAHLNWTKSQLKLIEKSAGKNSLAPSHQTTPPLMRCAFQDHAHTLPHGALTLRYVECGLAPRKAC